MCGEQADSNAGFGLGLAICKAVVDAHGGTIPTPGKRRGGGAHSVAAGGRADAWAARHWRSIRPMSAPAVFGAGGRGRFSILRLLLERYCSQYLRTKPLLPDFRAARGAVARLCDRPHARPWLARWRRRRFHPVELRARTDMPVLVLVGNAIWNATTSPRPTPAPTTTCRNSSPAANCWRASATGFAAGATKTRVCSANAVNYYRISPRTGTRARVRGAPDGDRVPRAGAARLASWQGADRAAIARRGLGPGENDQYHYVRTVAGRPAAQAGGRRCAAAPFAHRNRRQISLAASELSNENATKSDLNGSGAGCSRHRLRRHRHQPAVRLLAKPLPLDTDWRQRRRTSWRR